MIADLRAWLNNQKVPLSAALGMCAVLITAYIWLYAEFVTAAQFNQYQSGIERRILTEKAQMLDAEILKIEVKCRAYPRQCDAVDKALLERYRRDLARVQRELGQPALIRR
jgi:hypothetical protein